MFNFILNAKKICQEKKLPVCWRSLRLFPVRSLSAGYSRHCTPSALTSCWANMSFHRGADEAKWEPHEMRWELSGRDGEWIDILGETSKEDEEGDTGCRTESGRNGDGEWCIRWPPLSPFGTSSITGIWTLSRLRRAPRSPPATTCSATLALDVDWEHAQCSPLFYTLSKHFTRSPF